ncbi:MAG: hypothetical protein ACRDU8_07130 [Egibacteraceae bacterium]
MGELLLVAVMAAVWWIPAFLALSDLQGRRSLPRPVVWRWTAVLCVPVVGALVYFRRGRPALNAHDQRR